MTAITIISIEDTYVDCDGILRHKGNDQAVDLRSTIIDSLLLAELNARIAATIRRTATNDFNAR